MKTVLLLACTLVAACATQQERFTLEALGRVIAASDASNYERKKPVMIPIPIGGTALMPVAAQWSVTGSTRVYQVQLLDGRVVTTQSESEIPLGTCVRLRHASDLTSITPEYNYIHGKLQALERCPESKG